MPQRVGRFGYYSVAVQSGAALVLTLENMHMNSRRRTHGALLMDMLSCALWAAAGTRGEVREFRSLQFHFLASGHVGQRIECHAEVLHETRRLVFVQALVRRGADVLARANAIVRKGPRIAGAQAGVQRQPSDRFLSQHAETSCDAPFSRLAGPIYRPRQTSGIAAFGFLLPMLWVHQHDAAFHGGVGAALLLTDVALGSFARQWTGQVCATLSLECVVEGSAHAGQVLAANGEHLGSRDGLNVLRTIVTADGAPLLLVQGCWQELGRAGQLSTT